VRERTDVTDLGDQADRGQRVDAAQEAQTGDRCRPRALGGLLEDQSIQPLASGEQHLVMSQILTEDDLQKRLLDRPSPAPAS
jgi:hypothetical protein